MDVDGVEVLTAEEARSLTDRELRRAFIGQLVELVGDFGTEPGSGPVDDMPWLASQDEIDRLTVEQMREIVIQNQHWFYPRELRRSRELI